MNTKTKRKPRLSAQLRARAIAEEVLLKVSSGKKINMGEIMLKHGYSLSTSKIPQKVTEQPAFKEAMLPIVDLMLEERYEAIRAMKKKRNRAGYLSLSMAIKNLSHDINLISGRATENVAIMALPEAIIKKHGLRTIDSPKK